MIQNQEIAFLTGSQQFVVSDKKINCPPPIDCKFLSSLKEGMMYCAPRVEFDSRRLIGHKQYTATRSQSRRIVTSQSMTA
jgi:hypothetical protein